MTLHQFLLKTGVDIKDNKCLLGNHLEAELSKISKRIDFDKKIIDVTDEEFYEIGKILILSENKGVPFWSNEIVEIMKTLVNKHAE